MNPGKGQTRKATLTSILQKLFFNAGLNSWINFSDIVASKKWTHFHKNCANPNVCILNTKPSSTATNVRGHFIFDTNTEIVRSVVDPDP
jgi:hypothetical protein